MDSFNVSSTSAIFDDYLNYNFNLVITGITLDDIDSTAYPVQLMNPRNDNPHMFDHEVSFSKPLRVSTNLVFDEKHDSNSFGGGFRNEISVVMLLHNDIIKASTLAKSDSHQRHISIPSSILFSPIFIKKGEN